MKYSLLVQKLYIKNNTSHIFLGVQYCHIFMPTMQDFTDIWNDASRVSFFLIITF